MYYRVLASEFVPLILKAHIFSDVYSKEVFIVERLPFTFESWKYIFYDIKYIPLLFWNTYPMKLKKEREAQVKKAKENKTPNIHDL